MTQALRNSEFSIKIIHSVWDLYNIHSLLTFCLENVEKQAEMVDKAESLGTAIVTVGALRSA